MIQRELFPDPKLTYLSLGYFLVMHIHDDHMAGVFSDEERRSIAPDNVISMHAVAHARSVKWLQSGGFFHNFHHHLGYGDNLRRAIFACDQPRLEER